MPSLGNDLALIRKQRGLSLEEIRNATKIPPHILSSIEDDSLFSEMEEHKTYLRSYVRSYAKALKIDDETIVQALDQLEEGRYGGLLRREEEALRGPRFQLDEEGDKPQEGGEPEQRDGGSVPADTGLSDDMVHDHAPEHAAEEKGGGAPDAPRGKSETAEDEQEEADDETGTSAAGGGPAGTPPAATESAAKSAGTPGNAAQRVPDPPDVTSVDWADMGKKFAPLESRPRIWVGAVIAVILLAAAVFFLVYGFNGSGEEGDTTGDNGATPEEQAAMTPDSLQLDLSQEPAGAAGNPPDEGSLGSLDQAAESLPDTLVLAVYAAYERLQPVRIFSDVMNATNPYWIEHGEAFTFEFVDEIHIRGQYAQMELLLNGRPIPDFRNTFYNSETQMLEISRSWFEQDTVWLQPPPDSLTMDAPPPDAIRERPTFN